MKSNLVSSENELKRDPDFVRQHESLGPLARTRSAVRAGVRHIAGHPAPAEEAEINIQPMGQMYGVAGTQGDAHGVSLFRFRSDQAAPVVLLILDFPTDPPAGIGVPGPPAAVQIIGLLPRLELRVLPLPPRPVVVARAQPERPVPVYGVLYLGVERPQEDIIRDVLRHGHAGPVLQLRVLRMQGRSGQQAADRQDGQRRRKGPRHRSEAQTADTAPVSRYGSPTFHKTSGKGLR